MRMTKKTSISAEWFWNRIDRSDPNSCWNWSKSRTKAGYGRVWIYPKLVYAHRIAWMLTYGEIKEELCVCHHCDNPSCVNPSHLFLGTHQENMRDSSRKGRTRNDPHRGSRHALAKLSEEYVTEIKRKYRPGIPSKASPFSIKGLAKEYKVAPSLIWRILTGRSWPHVRLAP